MAFLHPVRPAVHSKRRARSMDHSCRAWIANPPQNRLTICKAASDSIDNVLSTQDIVIGVVLAIALAFLASFLQGRRNQADVVLWRSDDEGDIETAPTSAEEDTARTLFDGEDWKEMSQPDNYIFYNTKLRKRKAELEAASTTVFRSEKQWVLVALLLLFVPIFSFEFYLTLSRQVLCGENSLFSFNMAQELCSPHLDS